MLVYVLKMICIVYIKILFKYDKKICKNILKNNYIFNHDACFKNSYIIIY